MKEACFYEFTYFNINRNNTKIAAYLDMQQKKRAASFETAP